MEKVIENATQDKNVLHCLQVHGNLTAWEIHDILNRNKKTMLLKSSVHRSINSLKRRGLVQEMTVKRFSKYKKWNTLYTAI
jgi:Fe2+ or Zn2+ uptake regulation protein